MVVHTNGNYPRCMHMLHDVFALYTVGVPVPKPPNDEPLEQLMNLSQQEEVRNF